VLSLGLVTAFKLNNTPQTIQGREESIKLPCLLAKEATKILIIKPDLTSTWIFLHQEISLSARKLCQFAFQVATESALSHCDA